MSARWLGELILLYTGVGTVAAASTLVVARRRAVDSSIEGPQSVADASRPIISTLE